MHLNSIVRFIQSLVSTSWIFGANPRNKNRSHHAALGFPTTATATAGAVVVLHEIPRDPGAVLLGNPGRKLSYLFHDLGSAGQFAGKLSEEIRRRAGQISVYVQRERARVREKLI